MKGRVVTFNAEINGGIASERNRGWKDKISIAWWMLVLREDVWRTMIALRGLISQVVSN